MRQVIMATRSNKIERRAAIAPYLAELKRAKMILLMSNTKNMLQS
jgi:hypothetical protein